MNYDRAERRNERYKRRPGKLKPGGPALLQEKDQHRRKIKGKVRVGRKEAERGMGFPSLVGKEMATGVRYNNDKGRG